MSTGSSKDPPAPSQPSEQKPPLKLRLSPEIIGEKANDNGAKDLGSVVGGEGVEGGSSRVSRSSSSSSTTSSSSSSSSSNTITTRSRGNDYSSSKEVEDNGTAKANKSNSTTQKMCAKLCDFVSAGAERDPAELFKCLVELADHLVAQTRLDANTAEHEPPVASSTSSQFSASTRSSDPVADSRSDSQAEATSDKSSVGPAFETSEERCFLFGSCLRPHLSDPNPSIREAVLRVFRMSMHNPDSISEALKLTALDVYIIRALERDSSRSERHNISMVDMKAATPRGVHNQYAGERIQAIKLVRHMLKLAPHLTPRSIVFSIDSVAREKSDPFRIVCLEALRELAVANPKLVAECFGMATLFDAILDPSLVNPKMAKPLSKSSSSSKLRSDTRPNQHTPFFLKALRESILLSLLHIANTPSGRKHLHMGPKGGSLEFRRLLSPLLDSDYPTTEHNSAKVLKKKSTEGDMAANRRLNRRGERKINPVLRDASEASPPMGDRELRWQASCDSIEIMMRTWQGIFLLASDRQGGLRALFSMLVQPVPLNLRKMILHLVYRIICIGAPSKVAPDLVGLGDNIWRSSVPTSQSGNIASEIAVSGSPKIPKSGSKRKLMRQASKNWKLVRDGLGKLTGTITKSMENISKHSTTNNQLSTNIEDEYHPLKLFQEHYINQMRQKWKTVAQLVPGAWTCPPPTGTPVTSLHGSTKGSWWPASSAHHSSSLGGHNALDNYVAVVVLSLLHCGIVEPLIALGIGIDENNGVSPEDAKRSKLLHQEIIAEAMWQPGRQHTKIKAVHDLMHGIGLAKPSTRLLGLITRIAVRLLPQKTCRATLADLQVLISAGTNRNSTMSSMRLSGVDEDKYILGGTDKKSMHSDASETSTQLKSIARLPLEQLCTEDYSTRAAAMLRHLQSVSGFGSLFSTTGLRCVKTKAAEMLLPVDVLVENHSIGALSGRAGGIGGDVGFSHLKLARSLKSQTDNLKIDKPTLLEQLRLSHVTTTKEPSEWDWNRITDILEGPIAHNPAALNETLLHTKFFKRLGGFFRCDPGEKGYYNHLEWTPENCELFNRIAAQMLCVLLSSRVSNRSTGGYFMGGSVSIAPSGITNVGSATAPTTSVSSTQAHKDSLQSSRRIDSHTKDSADFEGAGVQFLRTDRRGRLIFEIVHHLTEIVDWIHQGGSSFGETSQTQQLHTSGMMKRVSLLKAIRTPNVKGLSSISNSTASDGSRLVFRRDGVLCSMCREYFMIIGLLSSSKKGLRLLAEAGLFSPKIYTLSDNNTYDYLTRQLLNYLDCAQPGPARNLVEAWLKSRVTSTDIKLHCINTVLHGLFRRRPIVDFAEWGISMLVECLKIGSRDKRIALASLRVLNEAASVREYVEMLVALKPPLAELTKISSSAVLLLYRVLTVPSGFDYLLNHVEINGQNWLERELCRWDMFSDIDSDPRLLKNCCCKYAHNLENAMSKTLFRDHETLQKRMSSDAPWSHAPLKIPVLNTANIGASLRGEVWLSSDSLGAMTNDGYRHPSPHIVKSGAIKPGLPVSVVGGGTDIDWLVRLPWRIVIRARDKMGWKEITTDAHFALVIDAQNSDRVKYVVRGKILDEMGAPSPYAITDSSTVLSCSLRIGDRYAVHSNGFLSDLQNKTQHEIEGKDFGESKSADTWSQGRGQSGLESKNMSPAMENAMKEVYGENEDSMQHRVDKWREQFFWCSDNGRLERMRYEHERVTEGVGRVDGSVRVWNMSSQDSAVRWRFASSNSLISRPGHNDVELDGEEVPLARLSAMLISVEYEVELQHMPNISSARVDLPPHLYGSIAACSQNAVDFLAHQVDLDQLVDLALKDPLSSVEHDHDKFGGLRHRAALYALGHIGAHEHGFLHIVNNVREDLVPMLIGYAESCPELSLRGVYLSVLGMLTKSKVGVASLIQHGWDVPGRHSGQADMKIAVTDVSAEDINNTLSMDDPNFDSGSVLSQSKSLVTASLISLPSVDRLDNFFSVQREEYKVGVGDLTWESMDKHGSGHGPAGNFSTILKIKKDGSRHSTEDIDSKMEETATIGAFIPENSSRIMDMKTGASMKKGSEVRSYTGDALRLCSALSSMITRTEAHKELRQLKADYPELCSDPELMCRVLDMMETHRMSLSVRRYLHGNFERAAQLAPGTDLERLHSALDARKSN